MIITCVFPVFEPPRLPVEYRTDDEDDDATARNLDPIDMIRPAPARAA
jgi:hypothetical protein